MPRSPTTSTDYAQQHSGKKRGGKDAMVDLYGLVEDEDEGERKKGEAARC